MIAPRSVVVLTVILSMLTSCARWPSQMQPIVLPQAPQETLSMVVATTRAKSDDPKIGYSGERGSELSIENVVVSVPVSAARKPGEVDLPSRFEKLDPDKAFLVTKTQPMNEASIHGWYKDFIGPKRRVLIFVHGFNYSYYESVIRFAQIASDLRVDVAPVLFSWPSRANPLDYPYDRESVTYSRFGLDTVLEKTINEPDVSEVTILAHSMGSWLTMESLRDIAMKHGSVSSKISDVILAAPDIDIDVFRRQLVELGAKRPRITIFSSQEDKALKISRFFAGDVDRLGGSDLRAYRKELEAEKINFIDATDFRDSGALGHNAFAESSEMLHILAKQLSTQSLTASRKSQDDTQ
ncbi:alpha/beta fold hydrolase [Rhizobium sp. FKY42]|uniref:alpha/beta hydrolase n=1 Tax=Rhizobium sp. FKY42 TaxID=2562310 RepID=UPI00148573C8|nr:alpha/beta fold hydrolase [Rhizobium sp. FKY42]